MSNIPTYTANKKVIAGAILWVLFLKDKAMRAGGTKSFIFLSYFGRFFQYLGVFDQKYWWGHMMLCPHLSKYWWGHVPMSLMA